MEQRSQFALDAGWFDVTFGNRWRDAQRRLGGKLASVFSIKEQSTGRRLVVRLSDPSRIGASRLAQVHRFMAHLSRHGVHTPLPLLSCEGQSFAIDEERGVLVEVFPHVEGCHPRPRNTRDAAGVATALAEFHGAGLAYVDLPGEESCDQNHVAKHSAHMEPQRPYIGGI